MFTLPDFKQKQILFIDTRYYKGETKIRFQNENVVFLKDEKIINRASCFKVFSIFIMGEITITSQIIKKSKEFGISIFFMNSNFEVYAEINYTTESNYLVRKQQYSMSEKRELELSKYVVKNKIKNQNRLLRSEELKKTILSTEESKDQDSLRGVEGYASKIFFKNYFESIN
jgi:CRISPR-associated protein Cas1